MTWLYNLLVRCWLLGRHEYDFTGDDGSLLCQGAIAP